MNIKDNTLKQSAEWLNFCNKAFDNIDMDNNLRNRVSAGLYHLCLEYHEGILQLAESSLYASAFTMLRPQFEGYIRGLWLQRCASEEQIAKFSRGKEPPKINSLIADIEQLEGYEDGALSGFKDKAWSFYCDCTHGGGRHALSRSTETEIVSSYSKKQIEELLFIASDMTLQVSVAFARLVNNDRIANDLCQKHVEIFQTA